MHTAQLLWNQNLQTNVTVFSLDESGEKAFAKINATANSHDLTHSLSSAHPLFLPVRRYQAISQEVF